VRSPRLICRPSHGSRQGVRPPLARRRQRGRWSGGIERTPNVQAVCGNPRSTRNEDASRLAPEAMPTSAAREVKLYLAVPSPSSPPPSPCPVSGRHRPATGPVLVRAGSPRGAIQVPQSTASDQDGPGPTAPPSRLRYASVRAEDLLTDPGAPLPLSDYSLSRRETRRGGRTPEGPVPPHTGAHAALRTTTPPCLSCA